MVASWEALSALPPVPPGDEVRAAVLVPIYEDAGRLRLIMTRRPDDMRAHPGDVVFPGGTIEPGDADPVAAAMREASEEVGLPRSSIVEVLGGLTPVHARSVTMMIAPVVARVQRPERLVPQPGEVSAIIEPLVDDLLDDDRWVSRSWGPGRKMWFFEFPEGVLWGATAFMVRDLLEYFRRIES
ncbi:MAG: CoA pyrophosphatase [Acidimicrobiia bacterium]|nr:MAG: CoA pyrophosphatase [Acidimicrobiia bacterium]